jgi:hypothetical protein
MGCCFNKPDPAILDRKPSGISLTEINRNGESNPPVPGNCKFRIFFK